MVTGDWVRTEIQDVYLGLYDGPHATPKPAEAGPMFLGIKNLTDDGKLDLTQMRHIAEEDFPSWTRRVLPRAGDIVFTYEATLNRYAIVPPGFRGCLGRRLALIRPNPERVDTHFLFYYFFGDEWRRTVAQNTNIGSTVDRIPLIDFPRFEISLPPLTTQRKIAAILSAYDDLIENNLRRIQILDEMAQRLYREWFVKFRFPGHENARMVDSPLGPIPEGWEMATLGEVSLRITDGSHSSPKTVDWGLPMASVKDLTPYGIDIESCRHISEQDFKKLVEYGCMPFKDDVLVAKDGASALDTVCLVRETRDVVLLSSVAILRPNPARVLPVFLRHYLDEDGTRTYMKNAFTTGAAIPRVVLKDFARVRLLVPPLAIQGLFDSTASLAEGSIQNHVERITVLRRTRDLLLPKLISGELDVSDLDIAVPEEAA